MLVVFADKDLEKLVGDRRKLERKYGAIQARLILRRIDDMRNAISVDSLLLLPGNYHLLKGDRSGQLACHLKEPYRLIFRVVETDDEQECLDILEIVDYH